MKKSGHQHGGLFQARTRHQSAVQCQMVSRKNINTSKIIQNEPDEPVLFSCVCVGGAYVHPMIIGYDLKQSLGYIGNL